MPEVMDAVKWNKMESLFAQVLALPSEERATFLDGACDGDAGLEDELNRLLSAYDAAPDFFSDLAVSVHRAPSEASAESPSARDPYDLVGRTFSHFHVVDVLGSGGMGVVYRAEDTRLRRTVALKFLPPSLNQSEEAKHRFVREARAASSLDHPNVCGVYEIDETPDGLLFIAMPCYDGVSLKERLENGPLSIAEARRLVKDYIKEKHDLRFLRVRSTRGSDGMEFRAEAGSGMTVGIYKVDPATATVTRIQ